MVVATEGATTDGRTIQRNWISEMAANYDPKKYGARVNLEHIKWRYMWNDDPHSKCYGDVIGLKRKKMLKVNCNYWLKSTQRTI